MSNQQGGTLCCQFFKVELSKFLQKGGPTYYRSLLAPSLNFDHGLGNKPGRSLNMGKNSKILTTKLYQQI